MLIARILTHIRLFSLLFLTNMTCPNETSLCTSFSAAFEVVVVAKLLSRCYPPPMCAMEKRCCFWERRPSSSLRAAKVRRRRHRHAFAHKWGLDCVGSFHRLRRRRRAFGRLGTPTKAFMVDNTNEIANVADAVLSKSLFDVTSGLDGFVSTGALDTSK